MKSINGIAQRLSKIKPSATLAVAAKAAAMKKEGFDVIDLALGEPDFDTPIHIGEAAIQAIHAGKTRYTAVDGILELREAICQKLKKDNQLDYQPNEIIVSTGAKQAIFNTMLALLNPGDEIIIPAPYWVSYPEMALVSEAVPVTITAGFEQQYKITAEQLKQAITPKTRMVILNSPSNPTGMVYSRNELEAIAEVLLEHPQIWILSDDIYEKIYWSPETFHNILMVCPGLRDRTILINGFSKAYAMTGWRLGYAAGPKEVIAAIKNLQSQSTSNPSSITQHAGLAALNGDQTCIEEMCKVFKLRHDYLIKELSQLPMIEVHPTQGAFYLFIKVEKLIKHLQLANDLALSELLLNEIHISSVPGSAFGLEGHLRISYATSNGNLEKMVSRLKDFLEK